MIARGGGDALRDRVGELTGGTNPPNGLYGSAGWLKGAETVGALIVSLWTSMVRFCRST